jgi:arylsulfatase A-like enzyme
VNQVDWAVGQVLLALERTGVVDDTLVIYTSDNGSYMYRWPEDQPDHVQDATIQGYHPTRHASNSIWRGTKADVWEGGHRVPFIARWPRKINPGSRCDFTICLTDFMATCAEMVGFSLPENAGEDSFSLIPLMEGKSRPTPRAPVIHHSSNGTFSLRDGKWKMVFGSGSGGREKPVGKPFEEPFFLFDLGQDPGEAANVIERFPDIASRLTEKLETIRSSGRSR